MATSLFEYTRTQLRSSPTLSAGAKAAAAKKAGREVIVFPAGQLEITPSRIPSESGVEGKTLIDDWFAQVEQDAARNGNDPRYKLIPNPDHYSPIIGSDGLRQVAAEDFTKNTGLTADDSHVAVSTGSKGVLNGIASQLKAGDKVIVASPGWPTNFDIWPVGVKMIEVDTGGTGLITAEMMRDALQAHPDAKMTLLNAPNNPTGKNYTAQQREELMGVLNKHAQNASDFFVISDNPYGKLAFDGSTLTRGPNEKSLFKRGQLGEVCSISKELGLAGHRVGYIVTRNASVINQVKMFNEGVGTTAAGASQNLAQVALLYGEPFIQRTVKDLKTKREAMIKGVKSVPGLSIDPPDGAIYGWMNCEGLKGKVVPPGLSLDRKAFVIDTPDNLLKFLIEVAGVAGVGGPPFSAPGSPAGKEDYHVRICFSGNQKEMERAFEKIGAAVSNLQELSNLVTISREGPKQASR